MFSDPFAIEFLDDREDSGEERYLIIGMAEGLVLMFVAYTERARVHSNHLSTKSDAV